MKNIVTENLRGFEIKFKTLPGIFSPRGLDPGTKLVVDSMVIKDGTMIADLGSGTGVIGLVAAKLNPSGHVHLLEDHLRSKELAGENVELNGLKNMEVYLSDLFSAVPDRTYHQIYCNPPQDMGNEFLEEIVGECKKHLKDDGEVYFVLQKQIKPVIERLFKKYLGNCTIVATGKIHVVLKGVKYG